MKIADLFLTVFIVALWGTNFSVVKIGLTEMPPLLLMGLRFALVALMLLPFVRMPAVYLKEIFGLSLTLGVMHFGVLSMGMTGVDAATGAIAIQLQVPFAALLAVLFLKEKLKASTLAGMGVAMAGVAIIAGRPDFSGDMAHLGLVLIAALGWAISNLQVKRLNTVGIFAINGYLAAFTAPQLLLLSWLAESGQRAALESAAWKGWGAVVATALVVIVGHGSWYHLVGKYPVSRMVPFTLLVPFFGVTGGMVLLQEAFSWNVMLGAGVVIFGLAIITLPGLLNQRAGMKT